jgi:hypothetical protein
VSLKDTLCHDNYRGSTWMGLMITFVQQLSGINAIMVYSYPIYEETGAIEPKLGNLILQIVHLFVTIMSSPLLQMYGRRSLLCVG